MHPPDTPPPSIPFTAALCRGPLQGNTMTILCHDVQRPEVGFVTESDDGVWTPEIAVITSP